MVREHLAAGSFYQAAEGVRLSDLDGNEFHDLTGSYGMNLLGVDTYRALIAQGAELVAAFGPTFAGLHPVVADDVGRLQTISGLDAVSFQMSGTEAVMQAVRLARYHTGRTHLVRFAGAYQGGATMCSPVSATRLRPSAPTPSPTLASAAWQSSPAARISPACW
jgi:glutamate-1-semialdehyde 2,1-aminomutase